MKFMIVSLLRSLTDLILITAAANVKFVGGGEDVNWTALVGG